MRSPDKAGAETKPRVTNQPSFCSIYVSWLFDRIGPDDFQLLAEVFRG
jgi:hypothetical protein